MRKHNLAFIDIETTGLNPDKHEIIEFGCVIVKQNKKEGGIISLDVIEEFEFKIKPKRIEDAEPAALRINKYDEAAWALAYDLEEVMPIIAQKTAGAIMVAHNVAFDFAFLDKAFRTTGVENKMHYHKLDTISIAFAKLYKKAEIGRFSLESLSSYFGIENKKAHTALPDARVMFELYKKLMEL